MKANPIKKEDFIYTYSRGYEKITFYENPTPRELRKMALEILEFKKHGKNTAKPSLSFTVYGFLTEKFILFWNVPVLPHEHAKPLLKDHDHNWIMIWAQYSIPLNKITRIDAVSKRMFRNNATFNRGRCSAFLKYLKNQETVLKKLLDPKYTLYFDYVKIDWDEDEIEIDPDEARRVSLELRLNQKE